VPVTEGSALARLLVLPIPESPRQPELMGRLQALMPQLPDATASIVGHLLTTQPWPALATKYWAHASILTAAAAGAQNGVRLAKSIAAVAVGLEVWASWLATVGLSMPADGGTLIDAPLGPSAAVSTRQTASYRWRASRVRMGNTLFDAHPTPQTCTPKPSDNARF